MRRETFDINKLKIAAPCPASWENMAGDERTRFCELCELSVHNISEMTQTEVRTLVTGATGRVCGRLYRRADGTVMTKDCPVGLKALRKKTARMAASVIATVLGLFSVSFSQTDDKKKKDSCAIPAPPVEIKRSPIQDRKGTIAGVVVDLNGAVLPGATVLLFVEKKEHARNEKPKERLVTDDNGVYKFTNLEQGNYRLEFRAENYTSLIVQNIMVNEKEETAFSATLSYKTVTVTVGIFVSEPQLNTTDSSQQKTFDRNTLLNLPINN